MKTIKLIVKAGLIVGTLDIVAAFINFYAKTGQNVTIILKYIASAIFGKSAMSGGTNMVLFGLLMHFIIAFIFTIIFAIIYPKLFKWFQNTIIISILYGLFIWLIMNLVIVPNSNTPQIPFSWSAALINWLILIFCIGLPLAYIFGKHYKNLNV